MSFLLVLAVAAAQPIAPGKAAVSGKSVTIQLDPPVGGRAYVNGHLLNCRSKPALDAEILTTIPQGSAVTVSRQQGDWQLIKLKSRSCWSHTRFLSTSEVAKPAVERD